MSDLSTTREVIAALDGIKAVAALTKRNDGAVYVWNSSNHFPPDTYIVMSERLRELGHTAPDSLWRMVRRDDA